jgi:hypothetical protein
VSEGIEPELLFDVAALLMTSVALGPAAEASVAPAAASISQVVDVPMLVGSGQHMATPVVIDPSAVGHPVALNTFEVTTAPTASIRTLTGISLLRGLAALPSRQLAGYLSEHPSVVSKLLASPPESVEVSDWWTSLGGAEQSTLTASAPQLVGNLDGVPVSTRNVANRAWMKESIGTLESAVNKTNAREIAESAEHQLHMLREVQDALKTTKSSPPRSLLSVDPTGQGKAAIVLGNVETADYVTYMVPGMFFTVDGQIDDWTADASDLYNQQVAWLHRLSKVDPSDANKTVAVVAWMGYQTPNLTNIASLNLAYQGRDALARVIEGMQAERAGDLPYTTVIAHSYGSTAALMALTEYDFQVDGLVLVGSPGSAAQSVKDLHVRNANVFVGAAAWDPVPSSAYFGSDPASPSYGAKAMGTGGGKDVITGKKLGGSIGHNEYFDAGSESVRNMSLIAIDHPELVMDGTAKDKKKTLALEVKSTVKPVASAVKSLVPSLGH